MDTPVESQKAPAFGEEQIVLLERLCRAVAVSGDEGEVRRIVLEEIRTHRPEAEIKVDALGNVLVSCRGQGENLPRVMVAAHMDEVGFMISHDEEDGIYRFEIVGGIDERHLVGKPILVGREHIPGVIGAKPIHLTKADERRSNVSLDSLRIDIGPSSGKKVEVGERAGFATGFIRTGPSVLAKALDDRLGVASLIELVKHAPQKIDLLAAFTVQEEVGLRGAQVAAYTFDPQLALVLDCTPANDLPIYNAGEDEFIENTRYNARLGAGPAIYVADRATLSDPRLVRYLIDTAEASGIPYQLRQPGGGGTDAGAIHKSRAGVPSVSISVPGRYLHTAASLARISDWENTLRLVFEALSGVNPDLLAVDRP